ncbi:MAG: hypothetical protein U0793_00030 [Gemmataceae bacterium]
MEFSTSFIDPAVHGRIARANSLGHAGWRRARLILESLENPGCEFGRHYFPRRLDLTYAFGGFHPVRQRVHAPAYLYVVCARRGATIADRPAPLIRKLLRCVGPGMLKAGPNLYFDREATDLRYNVHRSIPMAGPDPTIIHSCFRKSMNEAAHQLILSGKAEVPNDTNANDVFACGSMSCRGEACR